MRYMDKQRPIPIKEALHRAIYKMNVAKDTGNRDLKAVCRGFIQHYWPKRHANLKVIFNP